MKDSDHQMMNKLRYSAIIFDFDGVLVDSVDIKTQAFMRLYEHHGQEIVDKVKAHHLSHGGVSRYEKFKYYHKNFLGQELTEVDLNELAARFSKLVVDSVVSADWILGAKEFLEKYYNKIPLFVASGTPDAELRKIVNLRNMERFFKAVYGSALSKDDIINDIISEPNYQKSLTVMIGDSTTDYDAAIKTGVAFIGVGNMLSPVCESISDLRELESLLNE